MSDQSGDRNAPPDAPPLKLDSFYIHTFLSAIVLLLKNVVNDVFVLPEELTFVEGSFGPNVIEVHMEWKHTTPL